MTQRGKRRVFALIFTAFTLMLMEGALHTLALCSPRVADLLKASWRAGQNDDPAPALMIPDDLLGHRPNPAHHEHDEQGFRNSRAAESVAIVALGDSQTYGINATPDNTWPRHLERFAGKRTYNMAFGGYGPVHCLLLLPEALKHKPELIVVGFYAGNDLYDCYKLVHLCGQAPELATASSRIVDEIAVAKSRGAIADRIERICAAMYFDLHSPIATVQKPLEDDASFLRRTVSRHSRLYALLRAVKDRIFLDQGGVTPADDAQWRALTARLNGRETFCEPFEQAGIRTVFTSTYRLNALNLDDPRIEEGFEIAIRSLIRIRDEAAAKGVETLVVFIPTKEYAYRAAVTASKHGPSQAYQRLTAYEEAMWAETRSRLDQSDVAYVDATPRMRAALAAGTSLYLAERDGHPHESGYREIAFTVSEALNRPAGSSNYVVRETAVTSDK